MAIKSLNEAYKNGEIFYWCNACGDINIPGTEAHCSHTAEELPVDARILYDTLWTETDGDGPDCYIVSTGLNAENPAAGEVQFSMALNFLLNKEYLRALPKLDPVTYYGLPANTDMALYAIKSEARRLTDASFAANYFLDDSVDVYIGNNTDPDGHEMLIVIPAKKAAQDFNDILDTFLNRVDVWRDIELLLRVGLVREELQPYMGISKTWFVPVSWQICGKVQVNAETLAEAVAIVKDNMSSAENIKNNTTAISLPAGAKSLENSIQLNIDESPESIEAIRERYNGGQEDIKHYPTEDTCPTRETHKSVSAGPRICLEEMSVGLSYEPIQPGACGTLTGIDPLGQFVVAWDNGLTKTVVPGRDKFTILAQQTKELKLYFPVTGSEYAGEGNCFEVEVPSSLLLSNVSILKSRLSQKQKEEMSERGLMDYYKNDDDIGRKVQSCRFDVEPVDGKVWGIAVCQLIEDLSPAELSHLKSYIEGQAADGFGEGFEQSHIKIQDGPHNFKNVYLHLWNGYEWAFKETPNTL